MNAHLRGGADQPFGDVELVSGQTLAPFSRAGLTAADNLLEKADRALADAIWSAPASSWTVPLP